MHKPYAINRITANVSNFVPTGLSWSEGITILKSDNLDFTLDKTCQDCLTIMYNKNSKNRVFF